MMKAYRIVEWEHPPELTEAPIPVPGPGEILVEVAGNGLCHSDVGMALAPAAFMEPLGWRVPFTLGHEVGGHVAALGAGGQRLTWPKFCFCRLCAQRRRRAGAAGESAGGAGD